MSNIQTNDENRNKTIFKVLKIIGFIVVAIGAVLTIVGVILLAIDFSGFASNMGDMDKNNNDFISEIFSVFVASAGLLFIGLSLDGIGGTILLIGFIPQFFKFSTKLNKHVISENKETLTDIQELNTDIVIGGTSKSINNNPEAVKTIVGTIQDAVGSNNAETQNNTNEKECKYCVKCGSKILKSFDFCSNCGASQKH